MVENLSKTKNINGLPLWFWIAVIIVLIISFLILFLPGSNLLSIFGVAIPQKITKEQCMLDCNRMTDAEIKNSCLSSCNSIE